MSKSNEGQNLILLTNPVSTKSVTLEIRMREAYENVMVTVIMVTIINDASDYSQRH